MHYATIDNRIGEADTLPEGAVEISREQYKALIQAKMQGERVTVGDGEAVIYVVAYAPDGTERSERDPDEPLITAPPPEELHVPKWQDGEWVEAETDERREAREKEALIQAKMREKEALIQAKMREMAEAELVKEGKLEAR